MVCPAETDTHTAMTSLEYMQRPAALVPRPRLNLIHFYGYLRLGC